MKSDSNTRECKLGNSKEVLNTHPSQKLQDTDGAKNKYQQEDIKEHISSPNEIKKYHATDDKKLT